MDRNLVGSDLRFFHRLLLTPAFYSHLIIFWKTGKILIRKRKGKTEFDYKEAQVQTSLVDLVSSLDWLQWLAWRVKFWETVAMLKFPSIGSECKFCTECMVFLLGLMTPDLCEDGGISCSCTFLSSDNMSITVKLCVRVDFIVSFIDRMYMH